MELEDSLYPLLREVSIGIDPYEVFQDVEWALLIGAKPRGPGMERADLLDINGQIFAEQVYIGFTSNLCEGQLEIMALFLTLNIATLLILKKIAGKSSQCCCFS